MAYAAIFLGVLGLISAISPPPGRTSAPTFLYVYRSPISPR